MSDSKLFHLHGNVTIADEGLHNYMHLLGVYDLLIGRDLYLAIPDVTHGLGKLCRSSCMTSNGYGEPSYISTRIHMEVKYM